MRHVLYVIACWAATIAIIVALAYWAFHAPSGPDPGCRPAPAEGC